MTTSGQHYPASHGQTVNDSLDRTEPTRGYLRQFIARLTKLSVTENVAERTGQLESNGGIYGNSSVGFVHVRICVAKDTKALLVSALASPLHTVAAGLFKYSKPPGHADRSKTVSRSSLHILIFPTKSKLPNLHKWLSHQDWLSGQHRSTSGLESLPA